MFGSCKYTVLSIVQTADTNSVGPVVRMGNITPGRAIQPIKLLGNIFSSMAFGVLLAQLCELFIFTVRFVAYVIMIDVYRVSCRKDNVWIVTTGAE